MGKASRRKSAVAIQRVLDTAKNAIQTVAGAKEFCVRSDLPQEEKISHALSALLETEVPEGSSLAEYRAALAFIVIAWNISLLEADKRSTALKDFAATIDGTDSALRREAMGGIERLIIRKRAMFPHDIRTVVSWEVRFQGAYVRVSAAALDPSPSGFDGR